MMKKIGLLTSGGDAPGMNCAIRSVVRTSLGMGIDVCGIKRGFRGLYENDIMPLNARSVSGIINRGGTILRTIRFPEFKQMDVQEVCFRNLKDAGIDGLVVIGGDGSSRGAHAFHNNFNIPVGFIPASIDNDVYGTDYTVGFDTAVNTALDAIDKIRDTATSHERIFVVEVMGREHGFLALEVAIAAGAEVVVLPEKPITIQQIINVLETNRVRGKISSLIVVAEGAGKAHILANEINKEMPGAEARYCVLGYIQRGGIPTYQTRCLATMFGSEVVRGLLEGKKCFMTGISGKKIIRVSLEKVISSKIEISEEKIKLVDAMAI